MLKTQGIPLWVTGFAGLVFLIGVAMGLMALFGHGLGGSMDPMMTRSWGGRALGLGLVTGLAVLLKSPSAYLAALVGGLGRDLGDLAGELSKGQPGIGAVVGIVLFLIAGTLGALTANRARQEGL